MYYGLSGVPPNVALTESLESKTTSIGLNTSVELIFTMVIKLFFIQTKITILNQLHYHREQ